MNRFVLRRLLLAFGMALICGCAGYFGPSGARQTTSVVDYLYPGEKDPVADTAVPVLSLPMRVGIAFVPGGAGYGATLPEPRRNELLEQVAAHFRSRDFIASIEVIPSAYLTPGGSFANLEQLRTMHGIEAMVLVSYDQTQFTDEGLASLMYWTIVGAYVVKGEHNDTATMVDAVVMHIPSRRMLFRAPGTSQVKGSATLVNLGEQLRRDSEAGFDQAFAAMIGNLDLQLASFRERVRNSPAEYAVARQPGYTGSGSVDAWSALLVALVAGTAAWRRSRRR